METSRADVQRAYSINEVAAITGTTRKTIAAAIHSGAIPAYKVGKRAWRIRPEIVEKLQAGEL